MSLLVKLDRLIIGLILRSKLVFLISVQPHAAFIEGARLGFRIRGKCADYILFIEGARFEISISRQVCGLHSAECVDIDNESNQVP